MSACGYAGSALFGCYPMHMRGMQCPFERGRGRPCVVHDTQLPYHSHVVQTGRREGLLQYLRQFTFVADSVRMFVNIAPFHVTPSWQACTSGSTTISAKPYSAKLKPHHRNTTNELTDDEASQWYLLVLSASFGVLGADCIPYMTNQTSRSQEEQEGLSRPWLMPSS
jgi:hypothetical protein